MSLRPSIILAVPQKKITSRLPSVHTLKYEWAENNAFNLPLGGVMHME